MTTQPVTLPANPVAYCSLPQKVGPFLTGAGVGGLIGIFLGVVGT